MIVDPIAVLYSVCSVTVEVEAVTLPINWPLFLARFTKIGKKFASGSDQWFNQVSWFYCSGIIGNIMYDGRCKS